MPELPEVETILRGLRPILERLSIQDVIIRQPKLRWPIPLDLKTSLNEQQIIRVSRRGKYLLLHVTTGTLIIHLGMSGSLRILDYTIRAGRHDHFDLVFSNHTSLRLHDPRRFGAVLWTPDERAHPLLKSIGIEPLDPAFNGTYLQQKAHSRRVNVKSFIMNSKIVAGIGNIYAAESLFLANIHPTTPVNLISIKTWNKLAEKIQTVLKAAITKGGTTLKDFVNAEGKAGYFAQELFVYNRKGLPCLLCRTPLIAISLNQRSTVFCPHCQVL